MVALGKDRQPLRGKRAERKRGSDYRSLTFDYSRKYQHLDLRKHPEMYCVGKGEQGVLLVEPYKSEILPHWRFRSLIVAKESAGKITQLFRQYQRRGDFVGMDMARKYLQMGYTRARRYANHASGTKYGADGKVLPRTFDPVKAAAAEVFRKAWKRVEADKNYEIRKAAHLARYG